MDNRLAVFMFILLALPSTIFFALIMPPFQVADEGAHFGYARSIANGYVFPAPTPDGGRGGLLDPADIEFQRVFGSLPFHPENKATAAMFRRVNSIPSGPLALTSFTPATAYAPVGYLSAAIGLRLGDILHAGRLDTFYLGRIANGLAFVALGATGIALAGSSGVALLFVLLLPMTLNQAGSLSADSHVFGMTALICGLLIRLSARPAAHYPLLALTGLLVADVATVKLPMIAMAIPLIAIGYRRGGWALTAAVVSVVVPVLGWYSSGALSVATSRPGIADAAAQIHFLVSHPVAIVGIGFRTIWANLWSTYVQGFIGVFGWLDTKPPLVFFVVLFTIGLLNLYAVCRLPTPRATERPWFLIAGIVATAMTFGTLYLSFSDVGAPVVEGVQGRYFIPIAMPVLLGLAGAVSRGRSYGFVMSSAATSWAIAFATVPTFLVDRYYLS